MKAQQLSNQSGSDIIARLDQVDKDNKAVTDRLDACTSTGTQTPTATATRAPASAVPPTRAATSGSASVVASSAAGAGPYELLNVSARTDSTKYYHVIGEVRNNTNRNAKYVKVIGTFYDAAGKVVASDYTYSQLDIIPAGKTSPFEFTVSDSDQLQIASYFRTFVIKVC